MIQGWFEREMITEEDSTISHLSVAMATKAVDTTQTVTSSSFSDATFYFYCAQIVVGVVGTAGNALILYALVASKQHKKHIMIVNQNALDLFCCFFLVVTNVVRLCNIRLSGVLGYWLCITLLSEVFVSCGVYGATVNIAIITIDRYLKVVYPVLSKKIMRPWVIYSAVAFAWLVGIVFTIPLLFKTTAVIDGICWAFALYDSYETQMAVYSFYILFFYVFMLIIFTFCYWRILVTVRRQARVMARHNAAGSSTSTAQTISNQIESSVIKTMVLVAAFYAICYLPHMALSVGQMLVSNLIIPRSIDPLTRIASYLYITMNPFIYATKFDPVKEILKGMIPSCKQVSVQPVDDGVELGETTATGNAVRNPHTRYREEHL